MAHARITDEIADQVLERMSNGEILTAVAREYGFTHGAFYHRADSDEEFARRYARARERQAHAIASDVVRIVDEEDDPEKAQIAKNKSEARKWLAARIDPANYGDRLKQEHSGPNGEPIAISVEDKRAVALQILESAFGAPKVIEHEE
jgi:hypothetical protein